MSNAMINPLVYYYMNARYYDNFECCVSCKTLVGLIVFVHFLYRLLAQHQRRTTTLCDCENQISPVLQDGHLSMYVPSSEIVVGVRRDWFSRCGHSSREHWRSPFKSRSITTARLDTLLFVYTVYLYDVVESSLLDVHSVVYTIDSIVLIMDWLTSAFPTRLSFYTWVYTHLTDECIPSVWKPADVYERWLSHNRSMKQNDLRVAGSVGRLFYDCCFLLICLLFASIFRVMHETLMSDIPSAILLFLSTFLRDVPVIILTRTHNARGVVHIGVISSYVPISSVPSATSSDKSKRVLWGSTIYPLHLMQFGGGKIRV